MHGVSVLSHIEQIAVLLIAAQQLVAQRRLATCTGKHRPSIFLSLVQPQENAYNIKVHQQLNSKVQEIELTMATITKLITDVSERVEVESSEASLHDPHVESWSIERVKQHFESSTKNYPIICQRLPCTELPSIVHTACSARISPQAKLELQQRDPYFFGQRVLGQEGAIQWEQMSKFESYIVVNQGTIFLILTTMPVTKEDEARLERHDLSFDIKAYKPIKHTMSEGDMALIPARFARMIIFGKDSLLTVGNLPPVSQDSAKGPSQ